MATKAYRKVYTKLEAITKATVALRAPGVSNDELATVEGRLAQVVKTRGDLVTLQVFAGTEGIPTNAEVVFHGAPPTLHVSEQLSGRFFNAYGTPIDGGPEVEGEERQVGGPSVNPYKRRQPSELIPTGIAGIDLNNTLVSGQKIPFFADPDQPYNQVMADVALRADVDKIILGGMGLSNDDYLFFKQSFEAAGALDKIVSFVNTTEEPPVERLLIPDMALAAAEYFAVDKNEKVLVLLTDMTLYADALCIVSNRMDQSPSKDSMPGSLYSDLAKIYEKANHCRHNIERRRHHPRHSGQHRLHHRRPAFPSCRLRYGKGHRGPVPFALPSEAARSGQEDPRGPFTGNERGRAPICGCAECEDQAGEWFRPLRLRPPLP